jgi:hypothetical protein
MSLYTCPGDYIFNRVCFQQIHVSIRIKGSHYYKYNQTKIVSTTSYKTDYNPVKPSFGTY